MKHILLLLCVTACLGQSRVGSIRPVRLDNSGPASSAFNIPQVTRVDDQTIQVGANCNSASPCLFTDTYVTYAVPYGCNFVLSGGAAFTVNFVMDSYGLVALATPGSEIYVAGDSAACQVAPDAPQNVPSLLYPGSVILAQYSANYGAWNGTPNMTAALLHTWTFSSSTLNLTPSMSAIQIDLPGPLTGFAIQKLQDQAPKKGSACYPGTWAMDDNYLYRCAGADPSQQTGRWRVIPFTDW